MNFFYFRFKVSGFKMKNVGIICGGFSSEFEISVLSAKNIQQNFPDDYNPLLVFLSKEGWFVEVDGVKLEMNSVDLSYKRRSI